MSTLRVLLVEDVKLFRRGLKRILEMDAGVRVTGEASRADEALARLDEASFDLVMTDLSLPGHDGLWLVRRMQADHPSIPVVVVSLHEDPRLVRRALEAGALGYLLKSADAAQVRAAVGAAARGDTYLQPGLEEAPPDPADQASDLSLAEVELLLLARDDLDPETLREKLGLSVPSFDSRVRSLCSKLQVLDLAAALDRALEEKVLVSSEHD